MVGNVQEKQMGVIRVHGILPVSKSMFILSKLFLLFISDLTFAALLTVLNVGLSHGLAVLPAVLVHAGILSLIMALIGLPAMIGSKKVRMHILSRLMFLS